MTSVGSLGSQSFHQNDQIYGEHQTQNRETSTPPIQVIVPAYNANHMINSAVFKRIDQAVVLEKQATMNLLPRANSASLQSELWFGAANIWKNLGECAQAHQGQLPFLESKKKIADYALRASQTCVDVWQSNLDSKLRFVGSDKSAMEHLYESKIDRDTAQKKVDKLDRAIDFIKSADEFASNASKANQNGRLLKAIEETMIDLPIASKQSLSKVLQSIIKVLENDSILPVLGKSTPAWRADSRTKVALEYVQTDLSYALSVLDNKQIPPSLIYLSQFPREDSEAMFHSTHKLGKTDHTQAMMRLVQKAANTVNAHLRDYSRFYGVKKRQDIRFDRKKAAELIGEISTIITVCIKKLPYTDFGSVALLMIDSQFEYDTQTKQDLEDLQVYEQKLNDLLPLVRPLDEANLLTGEK